jgi:hypothetical protein
MTIHKYTLAFVSLLSTVALIAAPPPADNEEGDDRGSKLATSALIRTAELPADPASIIPLPWGTDSLDTGSVEVRSHRLLDVRLQGAPANMSYNVLMCGLTMSPNRCITLGAVTTDSEGRSLDVLNLPAAGNTWAAFFALTRGGATHYVSGFVLPPLPLVSNSAEVNVKGQVVVTNIPAGIFKIQGFTPLIYIDSQTKLRGFDGLTGLAPGTEVEVQGVMRPDGNLQALDVKINKGKGKNN